MTEAFKSNGSFLQLVGGRVKVDRVKRKWSPHEECGELLGTEN